MNKLAAEFLGTFWLVRGGCGGAVVAGIAHRTLIERD
jgi:glycerol uptake facilitator-like aquaporin